MPFSPGDHVQVARFGKGVIREVRDNNRYRVEIKGRAMIVEGRDLTPADARARRPAVRNADRTARDTTGPDRPSSARSTIDLHGNTVAEALAALDHFLNDAMLAGLDEVRVIHGRSGGRIKAAVHGRLQQLPSVRAFRVDPSNPGVTIVTL